MYKIKIGEREIEVKPQEGKPARGIAEGKEYALDVLEENGQFSLISEHKSYVISIVNADAETGSYRLRVNDREYELEAKDRFDLLLEELGMENMAAVGINDLKAPMPGLVLSVKVKAGDSISKGDSLLVLEAMKMENVLKAEGDAIVKEVTVKEGQAVEKNQVLIQFADQG